MPISSRISALLVLVASCGFPRPADVGSDAAPDDAAPNDAAPDTSADAPDEPGVTVHVSGTGDDANDGLTQPVKTLKRAIGIAAANHQITKIILANGRYSSSGGETFPYTVPSNVTIVGPAGGGAILAGSKAEPGMTVDAGTLQNLELEDFTVAITATGGARLANIRIRTAMIAVRAETTAKLTVDNLDVAGALAACATGIVLNGAADLAATTFATRSLGTTLNAKDQSTVNIAKANVAGDPGCTQTTIVLTNQSFMLSDSLVDGGFDGITANPIASALKISIANTVIRNMRNDALGGGFRAAASVTFTMTGGELSSNERGGAELGGGSWTFTNVTLRGNRVFGIYLQDGSLTMRGCTVRENSVGVYLLLPVSADLGTVESAGNNILQNNSEQSLYYDSSRIQVEAVGNTWNPRVQDADAFGRYVPAVLQGPVPSDPFGNYRIICDPGQCTLHR